MNPKINLVVIRAEDIDKLASFYELFGIEFEKHSHGKGPEHYAAELGDLVFEIYPKSNEQQTTIDTRIGFAVADIEGLVKTLVDYGAILKSEPKESPWGKRAVIQDLEGHKVELLEQV